MWTGKRTSNFTSFSCVLFFSNMLILFLSGVAAVGFWVTYSPPPRLLENLHADECVLGFIGRWASEKLCPVFCTADLWGATVLGPVGEGVFS